MAVCVSPGSPDYIVVPRILAAPGAGGISKTLQYGTSPLLSSLQLLNGKQYMSQFPDTTRSADNCRGLQPEEQEAIEQQSEKSQPDQPSNPSPAAQEEGRQQLEKRSPEESEQGVDTGEHQPKPEEDASGKKELEVQEISDAQDRQGEPANEMSSEVFIAGDVTDGSESPSPRPLLKTSNSGADIMLGLETDEGKTAEVEIDSLESDELQPEEIPKGRVRKTSIVEKLSKSKESELIALTIMETAGQRQREFEQLINEHQELVHEISRTPSAENIVQSEDGRDP
ncbi:hypothetical protein RRG08_026016 [Elysia crispata]|uniref:Uncharacterized protein n=1 Tax=Elysia crispata TaxID=231223 RepID=A0AAE1BCW4_9GAST|nr:hypothetical protein RRG08_026016 [Elysia crispata]